MQRNTMRITSEYNRRSPKPAASKLRQQRPAKSAHGRRRLAIIAGAAVLSLVLMDTSFADPNPSRPAEPTAASAFMTLWEHKMLTGDWGGQRPNLSEKGVDVGLEYIGETLSNVSGGARRGALYQGLLKTELDFDTEKMGGWKGGRFHVSGLWIHGTESNQRGDVAGMTGSAYLDPSNISAYDTYRLRELWFEQVFFKDKLSIRAGQLGLDEEFVCSDYACLFLNGTCGWPAFLSATVPSGGSAYPMAATGVRVLIKPIEQLNLMAAVVEGDVGEQSTVNRNGTQFRLDKGEGTFSIYEAIYRCNQGRDAKGLPGTCKLGGWYHSGHFDDLGFDPQGINLAEVNSIPLTHRGNGGMYLNVDQMLFREKEGSDEGLGFYSRVAPWLPGDRNPIDFYAAGGLVYKGLLPGHDEDLVGVAAHYIGVSQAVRDLHRNANASAGGTPNLEPGLIPDYEMAVEVTYQIVLAPWWSVQPDLQYIFHPGGSRALPNTVVAGIRTQISF